jgi:hypothetical protein
MSRGLGRVQRVILGLIEGNPDGAWTTGHLCGIIYKRAGKAQRVAVSRALRRMTLPGTWDFCSCYGRAEYSLCDPCNLASMKRVCLCDPAHFEPGGVVYKEVEEAKRYRDASPIERIKIRMTEEEGRFQAMKSYCGVTPEMTRTHSERMRALEQEKARLIAATAPPAGARSGEAQSCEGEGESSGHRSI